MTEYKAGELREQFLEKLDFLSAHWCEDDTQPFSFGGWRDEVADEFVQIAAQEVAKGKLELLQRLEKNGHGGGNFRRLIEMEREQLLTPEGDK